jgi:hypothetical protein
MSNPVPVLAPGIFSQSSRRCCCRAAVGRWSAACISPMKFHPLHHPAPDPLCTCEIWALPIRLLRSRASRQNALAHATSNSGSCAAFGTPSAAASLATRTALSILFPRACPRVLRRYSSRRRWRPPSRPFCVAPRLSHHSILASIRTLGLWRVHILTALRRPPHFSCPQTIIFLLTRCSCPPHNSILPEHGTSHH